MKHRQVLCLLVAVVTIANGLRASDESSYDTEEDDSDSKEVERIYKFSPKGIRSQLGLARQRVGCQYQRRGSGICNTETSKETLKLIAGDEEICDPTIDRKCNVRGRLFSLMRRTMPKIESHEIVRVEKIDAKKNEVSMNVAVKAKVEKNDAEKNEVSMNVAEKAKAEKNDAEKNEVSMNVAEKAKAENTESEKNAVSMNGAEKAKVENNDAEKNEVSMNVAEKAKAEKNDAERNEVSMNGAEKAKAEKNDAEKNEVSMNVAEKAKAEKTESEKNAVSMNGAEKAKVENNDAEQNEVSMNVAEKAKVEKNGAEKNEVSINGAEKTKVQKIGAENNGIKKKGAQRVESKIEIKDAGDIEVEDMEAENVEEEKMNAEKDEVEHIDAEIPVVKKKVFREAKIKALGVVNAGIKTMNAENDIENIKETETVDEKSQNANTVTNDEDKPLITLIDNYRHRFEMAAPGLGLKSMTSQEILDLYLKAKAEVMKGPDNNISKMAVFHKMREMKMKSINDDSLPDKQPFLHISINGKGINVRRKTDDDGDSKAFTTVQNSDSNKPQTNLQNDALNLSSKIDDDEDDTETKLSSNINSIRERKQNKPEKVTIKHGDPDSLNNRKSPSASSEGFSTNSIDDFPESENETDQPRTVSIPSTLLHKVEVNDARMASKQLEDKHENLVKKADKTRDQEDQWDLINRSNTEQNDPSNTKNTGKQLDNSNEMKGNDVLKKDVFLKRINSLKSRHEISTLNANNKVLKSNINATDNNGTVGNIVLSNTSLQPETITDEKQTNGTNDDLPSSNEKKGTRSEKLTKKNSHANYFEEMRRINLLQLKKINMKIGGPIKPFTSTSSKHQKLSMKQVNATEDIKTTNDVISVDTSNVEVPKVLERTSNIVMDVVDEKDVTSTGKTNNNTPDVSIPPQKESKSAQLIYVIQDESASLGEENIIENENTETKSTDDNLINKNMDNNQPNTELTVMEDPTSPQIRRDGRIPRTRGRSNNGRPGNGRRRNGNAVTSRRQRNRGNDADRIRGDVLNRIRSSNPRNRARSWNNPFTVNRGRIQEEIRKSQQQRRAPVNETRPNEATPDRTNRPIRGCRYQSERSVPCNQETHLRTSQLVSGPPSCPKTRLIRCRGPNQGRRRGPRRRNKRQAIFPQHMLGPDMAFHSQFTVQQGVMPGEMPMDLIMSHPQMIETASLLSEYPGDHTSPDQMPVDYSLPSQFNNHEGPARGTRMLVNPRAGRPMTNARSFPLERSMRPRPRGDRRGPIRNRQRNNMPNDYEPRAASNPNDILETQEAAAGASDFNTIARSTVNDPSYRTVITQPFADNTDPAIDDQPFMTENKMPDRPSYMTDENVGTPWTNELHSTQNGPSPQDSDRRQSRNNNNNNRPAPRRSGRNRNNGRSRGRRGNQRPSRDKDMLNRFLGRRPRNRSIRRRPENSRRRTRPRPRQTQRRERSNNRNLPNRRTENPNVANDALNEEYTNESPDREAVYGKIRTDNRGSQGENYQSVIQRIQEDDSTFDTQGHGFYFPSNPNEAMTKIDDGSKALRDEAETYNTSLDEGTFPDTD